jgi:hypothetical protein
MRVVFGKVWLNRLGLTIPFVLSLGASTLPRHPCENVMSLLLFQATVARC